MIETWLPLAQAHTGSSRELVDKLARTPISQILIGAVILTALRVALFLYLRKTLPHHRTGIYPVASFLNEALDALIYAAVFVFMIIRPFGVQAFVIPSGSMWPQLQVNDFIVANKAIYRYTDPKHGDIVVFHPPTTAALGPDDLDAEGDMKFDFVKRCIGLPGDVIEMKKGLLFRNGQRVNEPYEALSACIDPPDCTEYRSLSEDQRKDVTLPSFKMVMYKGRLIPLNYTEMDANSASPHPVKVSETATAYHVADTFVISDPADQIRAEQLPAQPIPKDMYLMMGDNRNNSFDGRGWGLVSRDRIVGRGEFVWWPLSQMQRLR